MRRWLVVAGLAAGLVGSTSPASAEAHAAGHGPPGTVTRPILTPAEAARFTERASFGQSGRYAAPAPDPWWPAPIASPRGRPDAVVGPSGYPSLQAAVNAVVRAGGTKRRFIEVLPGTYTGTVFIPAGDAPLTVYGAGRPDDVKLEFTVDATITPAAWAALVNPTGQYVEGDPAWAMYNSCATKTSATAGLCATVVWSQRAGLQLRGLTITNTLLDTVDRGTHQALALRTDADKTQLERMRLIGRQDTFYANADDTERIARVSVRHSYVEGDTDFVFGRAAAVFDDDEFRLVSSRKASGGVIFAPNTPPAYPYGFLVQHSRVTADAGYVAAPTGYLGRAWDQGASTTGYVPGVTPNGQLVIRDSSLGPGFNPVTPWAPAATTSRPFAARIDPGRDLNDVNYNRLWEYRNCGPSA
jgi:pectinesterase